MHFNDSRLQQFLMMDESTTDYQSVVTHVEACPRCQKRLVELSNDDDFLQEFQDTIQYCGETEPYHGTIGSSVAICVEPGACDDGGAECEPISLDFLAAPGHPEMLGRIGRYDVERMIGSGGMGIVLKGFDTELHRVVAIKVLKPHLAHIGAARHRFAREAQSAAAVVHEHVIPIYDVQSEGEMPFLVMQYVPGQSLQAKIDERGPLEPKEVLRIAMQAAAGLAAAHAQGLVHRDVKPANILMEESVERVLISDFGLARTVDDATLTRTGIVAGTPQYMSPEQGSGQAVDHRSDLFSLGSVIYFMCTGRPPFRAEHALAILNRICHDPHRPVDEINHEIPAELAEAVDQLLAKRPCDRFKDAHEVERRLESILAQLQRGQRSHRLHWRRGWLRWRSTIQKTLLGFSAATACVVTGIGLSWWLWNPASLDRTDTALDRNASDRRSLSRTEIEASGREQLSPRETAIVLAPDALYSSTPAPDSILNELTQVQSMVRDLENRWDRSSFASEDDGWTQELDRILATIRFLELAPPKIHSLPGPPSTVERIE